MTFGVYKYPKLQSFDRSHWPAAYSKTAKLRPMCFLWSLSNFTKLQPKNFCKYQKVCGYLQ